MLFAKNGRPGATERYKSNITPNVGVILQVECVLKCVFNLKSHLKKIHVSLFLEISFHLCIFLIKRF